MALRSLAARHAKTQWLFANQARLMGEVPSAFTLPTIDRIDPDTFYSDHYALNRPAKLTA